MKLNKISKNINYTTATIGMILALSISAGFAGGIEPTVINSPGKIYLGIFGGFASSNDFNVKQYGTAFFTEDVGGPLAVNAFGDVNGQTSGLVGAHIGYAWTETSWNSNSWGLVPAVELEGYYLTQSTFTGHDVNNDTTRLEEHDFLATYPTRTGVFLTNAVLNINSSYLGIFHPYIGVGFGGAISSISNASALQVLPPEPDVNHFNSNPSDTAATFAGQAKIGLSFDLSKSISMFIEYRWLYLSTTSYIFGSTVVPGHAATSSWQVKMDPRHFNIGVIGIQFST